MIGQRAGAVAGLLALTWVTAGCKQEGEQPWTRPAPPPAPQPAGLSFVQDEPRALTWFFSDGAVLALYDNAGNTFTEFWADGVNLVGGFDRGAGGTNVGPARKGHGPGYPFGRLDAQPGIYGRWEGFWAGFNYVDTRWFHWTGVNGNPDAAQRFEVTPAVDGALDVHVTSRVAEAGTALFECDVRYRVTAVGVGVRSEVRALADLWPWGLADTGGQLLMTQVDSDLDPALPYDRSQPDQYFQLALDGHVQELDPYPPYNAFSPSNEYADHEVVAPPEARIHPLPDTARVTTAAPVSYLTVLGRASRAASLALRVDRARSSLPDLEVYSELNGERDYLNYLYSAAVGENRAVTVVAEGTVWRLYGDLRPWTGSDPAVLLDLPLLSDGL